MLQNSAFLPEDVKRMGDAYEQAFSELRLADRTGPVAEALAQYIIEAAQTGEKDPERICAIAIERIKGTKFSS
jgi:hypothetical protein